jgi:hypothetical protein
VKILLYREAISGDSTALTGVIARRSSTQIWTADVVKIEFQDQQTGDVIECRHDADTCVLKGPLGLNIHWRVAVIHYQSDS